MGRICFDLVMADDETQFRGRPQPRENVWRDHARFVGMRDDVSAVCIDSREEMTATAHRGLWGNATPDRVYSTIRRQKRR